MCHDKELLGNPSYIIDNAPRNLAGNLPAYSRWHPGLGHFVQFPYSPSFYSMNSRNVLGMISKTLKVVYF